jgi:hypothetical protein
MNLEWFFKLLAVGPFDDLLPLLLISFIAVLICISSRSDINVVQSSCVYVFIFVLSLFLVETFFIWHLVDVHLWITAFTLWIDNLIKSLIIQKVLTLNDHLRPFAQSHKFFSFCVMRVFQIFFYGNIYIWRVMFSYIVELPCFLFLRVF